MTRQERYATLLLIIAVIIFVFQSQLVPLCYLLGLVLTNPPILVLIGGNFILYDRKRRRIQRDRQNGWEIHGY